MIIELLEFKVDAKSREKFIQQDQLIWTNFLSNYPGFLGKEVWIDPNDITKVTLIVKWETRKQWKSIPQKDLLKVDRHFAGVMNQLGIFYKSSGFKEYQIRKFR